MLTHSNCPNDYIYNKIYLKFTDSIGYYGEQGKTNKQWGNDGNLFSSVIYNYL
jgi:hypothetical protein